MKLFALKQRLGQPVQGSPMRFQQFKSPLVRLAEVALVGLFVYLSLVYATALELNLGVFGV